MELKNSDLVIMHILQANHNFFEELLLILVYQ